jgi:putative oxidoreductase
MTIAKTKLLNMFLAAIYLGFGFSSLLGQDNVRQAFFTWGYPDWFRMVVGFLEVVAGGCLLIPPAAAPAAGVLVLIMLGAMGTHVRSGEAPYALVPLLLAALLAFVGYRAWKNRTKG